MRATQFPITNQFIHLKEMFKSGDYDINEFDELSRQLINQLASLSIGGVKEIEEIDINLWKDRVWFLIERVGLLPKLSKHELEEEEEEMRDDSWYKPNLEFELIEEEIKL